MTNDEQAERDRRAGAAVMAWECPGCRNSFRFLPLSAERFPWCCDLCTPSIRATIAAALREEAGR